MTDVCFIVYQSILKLTYRVFTCIIGKIWAWYFIGWQ